MVKWILVGMVAAASLVGCRQRTTEQQQPGVGGTGQEKRHSPGGQMPNSGDPQEQQPTNQNEQQPGDPMGPDSGYQQ